MNWIIRSAGEPDAGAISALILGLSEYFIPDPESPDVQPFLETLCPAATAERIGSAEFDYFVAEDNAGIRGVIAVQSGKHLYHLFVDSRAQRQGLARLLWNHARKHSEANAFTVNASPYAVPVYERLGFTIAKAAQKKNGLVFVPMTWATDPATESGEEK